MDLASVAFLVLTKLKATEQIHCMNLLFTGLLENYFDCTNYVASYALHVVIMSLDGVRSG